MLSPPPSGAAEITRRSKSNLALAFIALPPERRYDISVFYAFCRLVDDIADEPGEPAAKQAGLDGWRRALREPFEAEPELAGEVRALMAKYALPVVHFEEIIAGVEMDLHGARYATWEDLRLYCHRVASVVGLVSVEVFGGRGPACRQYAEQLGLALQLTNILRDVAADLDNDGRIYLPAEDMERFGVSADDLRSRRRDKRFLALMEFEAERALGFYQAAAASLPPSERRAMLAAEIMAAIYRRILEKMRRDGFRVFDRRYALSKGHKAALILGTWLRNRWS